jgi:hypothetical protein
MESEINTAPSNSKMVVHRNETRGTRVSNTDRLFGPSARRVRRCLAVLLALLIPVAVTAEDLSKVYDAALEGDMAKAFAILDSTDVTRLDEKDRTAAECLRKTFGTAPALEQVPSTSARILRSYQRYWQQAMLRRVTAKDAERELLDSLQVVLRGSKAAGGPCDLDCASESVKTVIRHDGLFALTGVTSPYYELMLWKTRRVVPYHIALTERSVIVPVVFLDDFVSLGWAAYATCGRSSTGGWTANDSLYAVASSYDTTSESFRVSYLAHEGRHFADHGPYPKLDQPELEYRAKLTEIALSDRTTRDLILDFSRSTGTDRSVPHHFANYCVARDLARKIWPSRTHPPTEDEWTNVSLSRLRQEARALLADNDARLRRLGPTKAEKFLTTP